GIAQGDTGRQIERYGDHGELPLVTYGQRCRRRLEPRQGGERHLATRSAERHLGANRRLATRAAERLATRTGQRRLATHGGAQANVLQILQAILKLRFDLQHDPILVRLRKDGRDLPLPKGVIQRIVDRLWADAETRRRIAVNDQARLQAQDLGVAGHITQLRQLLQLLHKAWRPQAQLFGIGSFEAVLKLCTADAVLDRQVLHRLHEQRNALDIGQGRLQAADDVAGADMALFERLQVDLDTPAVDRRIGAVNADERRTNRGCMVLD